MNKERDKQQKILEKVKGLLKKSGVVKSMFVRFDTDLSRIDDVPVEFSELNVSAKTKNKKIYINNLFLDDDDFTEHMHYVVHELCHFLQQVTNEVSRYPDLDAMDYLDQPTEVEAFSYQIKFIKEFISEKAAKEYLEDLLDFHEYDGSHRKRKEKELLE